MFQIVDDLLDITATDEQLGKPAGHDMVEGVYTLPVLRTLAGEGDDAAELEALLGRPLDPEAQADALAIVRSGGGVRSAIGTAQDYVERAAAALDGIGANTATEALRLAPATLLDSVAIKA